MEVTGREEEAVSMLTPPAPSLLMQLVVSAGVTLPKATNPV